MTDNYYKQCPPMMSDGRLFTDHRTATRREEYTKYVNDIVRDDEYRLFLQSNAEKILDGEWGYYRKNKSCWANECVHNYPTRVYPPWFVEERNAYNSLYVPNHIPHKCDTAHDYRMTITRSNINSCN